MPLTCDASFWFILILFEYLTLMMARCDLVSDGRECARKARRPEIVNLISFNAHLCSDIMTYEEPIFPSYYCTLDPRQRQTLRPPRA
jgi:hypothetical protein